MTQRPKSTVVVGYIRMSSDKQEQSPAQQRREIEKLAKRRGYRLLRIYEDHGITGDSLHQRPSLCEMLEDAQKRQFDVILCWTKIGSAGPI
jgi:DNA invertase Pin-like site-specific DNA recombinase